MGPKMFHRPADFGLDPGQCFSGGAGVRNGSFRGQCCIGHIASVLRLHLNELQAYL